VRRAAFVLPSRWPFAWLLAIRTLGRGKVSRRPNLDGEDLLLLRYMRGHDRYWPPSGLAPQIGLSVTQTARRLEVLEKARLVKRLGNQFTTGAPEFCITNSGITEVSTRRS
jgi:hypothetical protein